MMNRYQGYPVYYNGNGSPRNFNSTIPESRGNYFSPPKAPQQAPQQVPQQLYGYGYQIQTSPVNSLTGSGASGRQYSNSGYPALVSNSIASQNQNRNFSPQHIQFEQNNNYNQNSALLNNKIKELESALQNTRSERLKKMSVDGNLNEEMYSPGKSQLFDQIKSMQNKIQELTKENHSLKTILDKKTQEITISKSIEEKLSMVITENEKLIEFTQKKDRELNKSLDTQNELRENLEDASNALEDANKTILALESKMEELFRENNKLNSYMDKKNQLEKEIHRLATLCSQQESKNKSSESKIKSLEEQNKSKDSKINELFQLSASNDQKANDVIRNKDYEIKTLKSYIQEKDSEIVNLLAEQEKLHEFVNHLQENNESNLVSKHQELLNCLSELEDMKKINEDYEQKLSQLLEENENLNNVASGLDEKFKVQKSSKDEEVKKIKLSMEKLNMDLIAKGDELQKSIELQNELVQLLESSKTEINSLKSQLHKSKIPSQSSTSFPTLIKQNNELKNTIESKQKEIEELRNRLDEQGNPANSQLNYTLKLEIESLKNENMELQSTLQGMESHEHMVRNIQEDCEQFENKFTEIFHEKQAADSRILELQAQVSDLENTLTSKEVSYTHLQKKCKVLEKAIKDVEMRALIQSKEVKKVNEENKKLQEKLLSQSKSIIGPYLSTAEPYNNSPLNSSSYENLEVQLEHWKSINDNNKEEIKKLYSLLKARKNENDALQSKLPNLEAKNRDLENANTELEGMNEMQRSQIKSLEEVISRLDSEVLSLRKSLENNSKLYKEVVRELKEKNDCV